MNAMYASYGLQGQSFATLPSLRGYQLFKQQEQNVITLDIQKELTALTSPSDTLHITVPTLGFTDPHLDYLPLPQFAIPLSLNGYAADDKNSISAKAQVFGTDISGRRYPLIRNHNNKVDYALIKEREREAALFTTLRAITYVFYSDQIAQGLVKIPGEPSGMMEFYLCYKAKAPIIFSLQVKNEQGKELLARDLCYYPTQVAIPKATFTNAQTIDCKVEVSDPFAYFRSRWVCNVELQDTCLRLTHHAGLSYASTRALLEHLIPSQSFFTNFIQRSNPQSQWNRYDLYPEYQAPFYEHLIESILNQSLPLIALQDFFKQDAHQEMQLKMLSEHWDEHDKVVFKSMKRLPSLDNFVDALDELIALRDPLLSAMLQPSLHEEREELQSIQVSLTLEDKLGQCSTICCQHQLDANTDEAFGAYVKVGNDSIIKGGVENERRTR